jgi:hypothetical protein
MTAGGGRLPRLDNRRSSIVFGPWGSAAEDETRLHQVNLTTGAVSTMRQALRMRRCSILNWSPDGRFIAGLAGENWRVTIYDVATRKQTEIPGMRGGWPSWSRDGDALFLDVGQAW